MDATQWALDANNNNNQNQNRSSINQEQEERKVTKPNKQVVNCPRCKSTNTKFCYYNNYSLNQPRYFCKACRRYWTQGGSLRNVPVGGGSKKNKRSCSSSSLIPKPIDHFSTTLFSSQSQYPNLGGFQQQYHDQFQKSQKIENSSSSSRNTNHILNFLSSSSNTTNLTNVLPQQHMVRTEAGLNSFNMNPGFNFFQEFKPTMNGFPFHESAGFQQQDGFNRQQISTTRETINDQNMGQGDSTVYWN